MKAVKKERLDKLLVQRGLAPTRTKAQALIMAGEVYIEGEMAYKAGTKVPANSHITLKEMMPYVSRGGYKLAGALEQFSISVTGAICADVGASTGGFTDVLLQNGAKHVYAIDVGYGQLAWKLRRNKRVTTMERINARHLESLPELVQLVVIDVSFISLRLIMPAVRQWLAKTGEVLALVKPQFEAGKKQVGKGGIVKEPAIHHQVLTQTIADCLTQNLYPAGIMPATITGSTGNQEFLLWLKQTPTLSPAGIQAQLSQATNHF